jgi:sugar phosphate isomerase/epimerase
MNVGLLSACLPRVQLEELVPWAAGAGLQALELAAWPPDGPWYSASHAPVAGLASGEAERVRALLDEHGIAVSSLAYYDNNLHPDRSLRERIHEHLRACIDAAPRLGAPTVCTFVGRDPTRSVAENLRSAEAIFAELVDRAGQLGVTLAVENCFMNGWHPDGYAGNLAYSPELWEWLFAQGLYLNYDPSHLLWIGIDPVTALRPYLDRIPHAQAKDAQLDPRARNRYGFFGKTLEREHPWDEGWWRYRVPGRGQVDWSGVVDTLYEGGFTGVLSVEHEDPVWSGSPARVKQGLEIAYRTLRPLITG